MMGSGHTDAKLDALVLLLLTAAVLGVFWPATQFPFVNYDDAQYVGHRLVQGGFSREGFVWAMRGPHHDLWHPLTTLSHMVDCAAYGQDARGHHLSNILLHLAGTLLLFLVLRQMTGARWQSAMVAAFFAVHPLHVEPVVWVSCRKDVLSGLFFMLTLIAYAQYRAARMRGENNRRLVLRYAAVCAACAGALMSKPTTVTLPLVLLLLDYWPMRRFCWETQNVFTTETQRAQRLVPKLNLGTRVEEFNWRTSANSAKLMWAVVEKAPLLILALGCSIANVLCAKSDAVRSLEEFPLEPRIANALASYFRYLGKLVWPADLAPFYPHPGAAMPVWQGVAAGIALILLSVFVLVMARRKPYLPVGWFWYAGVLVPMIGLVQTGGYAMADRYTYLSLIGVLIMLVWGVSDLAARFHVQRFASAVGVAAVLACVVVSMHQVQYWRSSRVLWEHAVQVTIPNSTAYNNLGMAYLADDELTAAAEQFAVAHRLKPTLPEPLMNLGTTQARLGHLEEAAAAFRKTIEVKPDYALAWFNLGLALSELGKTEEAVKAIDESLRLDPDYEPAQILRRKL